MSGSAMASEAPVGSDSERLREAAAVARSLIQSLEARRSAGEPGIDRALRAAEAIRLLWRDIAPLGIDVVRASAELLLEEPRQKSEVLAIALEVLGSAESEASFYAKVARSPEGEALRRAAGFSECSAEELAACWRARAAAMRGARERLLARVHVVPSTAYAGDGRSTFRG